MVKRYICKCGLFISLDERRRIHSHQIPTCLWWKTNAEGKPIEDVQRSLSIELQVPNSAFKVVQHVPRENT